MDSSGDSTIFRFISIAEVSMLSFLGLGDPTVISWERMLSIAQTYSRWVYSQVSSSS